MIPPHLLGAIMDVKIRANDPILGGVDAAKAPSGFRGPTPQERASARIGDILRAPSGIRGPTPQEREWERMYPKVFPLRTELPPTPKLPSWLGGILGQGPTVRYEDLKKRWEDIKQERERLPPRERRPLGDF